MEEQSRLFEARLVAQIVPAGIETVDEVDSLFASPRFDLLFAGYRAYSVVHLFKVHESADFVAARETRDRATLVLLNASEQVSRDASVEGSGAVSEDVDVEGGQEQRLSERARFLLRRNDVAYG